MRCASTACLGLRKAVPRCGFSSRRRRLGCQGELSASWGLCALAAAVLAIAPSACWYRRAYAFGCLAMYMRSLRWYRAWSPQLEASRPINVIVHTSWHPV